MRFLTNNLERVRLFCTFAVAKVKGLRSKGQRSCISPREVPDIAPRSAGYRPEKWHISKQKQAGKIDDTAESVFKNEKMKAAIKREKSGACSSYSEREQTRRSQRMKK